MQIKPLQIMAILAIIILTLTACAAPAQEQSQESPSASAIYYNDYLGLSITVPTGWKINAISDNLSLRHEETAAPQLIYLADGSSRMELLDIQNTPESSVAEHSRFYAYADIFPAQVETAQYIDLLTSLLQSPSAPYTYSLQKREQVQLVRRTAERIQLQVSISGYEQTYIEEYYIVPLERSFLILYINYWPQNDASYTAAISMLDKITLPEP